MSGSRYLIASDGRPARVSGYWAMTKLRALADFTRTVNVAMKKTFNTCFIDLMAGGGKNVIANRWNNILYEFEGSPLLAQATVPPFSSLVLVEADTRLTSALEARLGHDPRVSLIAGDCNDLETIARIRAAVPSQVLGIAFVDNLGLNVTFETLRALTQGRRMDLIVTFQVSALKRTVHLAVTRPSETARWDAFFGTHDWLRVVEDCEAKRVRVRDIGKALTSLYRERLATIGYLHHAALPEALTNTRNAKLYTVELFSKHNLGAKLFNAVSPADDRQGFLDF